MARGYVYFVREETCTDKDIPLPTKIGRATNVNSRVSSLQVGNMRPLTLINAYEFPTLDLACAIESTFHLLFAHCRLRGEWFCVPQSMWEANMKEMFEKLDKGAGQVVRLQRCEGSFQ